jgi:hypothetical protein
VSRIVIALAVLIGLFVVAGCYSWIVIQLDTTVWEPCTTGICTRCPSDPERLVRNRQECAIPRPPVPTDTPEIQAIPTQVVIAMDIPVKKDVETTVPKDYSCSGDFEVDGTPVHDENDRTALIIHTLTEVQLKNKFGSTICIYDPSETEANNMHDVKIAEGFTSAPIVNVPGGKQEE